MEKKDKQKERGLQEARMNELLEKYTKFKMMTGVEKIRMIRLCTILAYIEAADRQQMTIRACCISIETFLETFREKFEGEENKSSNSEIVDIKKAEGE